MNCPRCGMANQPDATFCGNCGASLASVPTGPGSMPPGSRGSGNRKTLLVFVVVIVVVVALVAVAIAAGLFKGSGSSFTMADLKQGDYWTYTVTMNPGPP